MKLTVAVLLFVLFTFPLYPDSVKDTFSTEYIRKDFTDQSLQSELLLDNTFSIKIKEGPVFLTTVYFELRDDFSKAGAGIGTVFSYLNNFYSEISYGYYNAGGVSFHRIYGDVTYEEGWGYITLGIRADFSTDNVLLSSLGMKNYLPAGFSLWNRYTLAVSTAEEMKHALWSELQYQVLPFMSLKTGLTAEWPVIMILPEWKNVEFLAGVNIQPAEIFAISYQTGLQQQEYAFQQRHIVVITLKSKKEE